VVVVVLVIVAAAVVVVVDVQFLVVAIRQLHTRIHTPIRKKKSSIR